MDPLHTRLRAAREAAGLSQPELFRLASGVSYEMVRGMESAPGRKRHRYPSPELLAAYVTALGDDPLKWPEYRLAQARIALDERASGLDDAVETLTVFEAALTQRPTARARRERERASGTQQQTPRARPGASSRRAT